MEEYEDSDQQFLDMLRYFHEAKGDITRYTEWDEERFKRLDPAAHAAWVDLARAEKLFNRLMRSLGE